MPLPKKGTLAKPTVLDEKAQKLIIQLMADGNFLVTALAAAGINQQVYYYWKDLYESGDVKATPFIDFFESLQKAAAKAEAESVAKMRNGDMGWQGSARFLESRFKKRWGKKVTFSLPKDPKDMTDAELEAIARGKGDSGA